MKVMPMRKSIKSLVCFIFLIFSFLICASGSIAQQEYINPIDADKYIGMEKTVCGTVASEIRRGNIGSPIKRSLILMFMKYQNARLAPLWLDPVILLIQFIRSQESSEAFS
jgi:hypothetical protein